MARLEGYSSLSRKQEDLFKKGYCFGSAGLATFSHQTSDLLLKTRVGKRLQGPVYSNLSGVFKHGDFTFTPKRKTDNSHLFSFEYAPDKDNKLKGELRVVTEAGAVISKEPTLTVEHSRDNVRVKAALTTGPTAKLSGTFGRTDFGVGVDTKVALNALALPTLNVAGWYNLPNTYSVFKFEGFNLATHTLSKISASLFLNVSPVVRVGSLLSFNLESKTAAAEFGGEYQLTDKTLVKGKLDNAGLVSVALQQQLNPHVKFTVASQVASAKVISPEASDLKLGFRLDFTD
jgi:hypothetical protein